MPTTTHVRTPRIDFTVVIYVLAAAGAVWFSLGVDMWSGRGPSRQVAGVLFSSAPLLFAFAYPRFLFAAPNPNPPKRLVTAAILHGLAVTATIVLFCALAPFPKNPALDLDFVILSFALVAWLTLLVAGVSLLFRGNFRLPFGASILFWPCWLLLALASVGRFFDPPPFQAFECFFCFLSPILFALAAGTIPYRPILAHAAALATFVALPWLFSVLQDRGLGNIWLTFNEPADKFRIISPLKGWLLILSVALMVLAWATAVLRLVPPRWRFRELSLSSRTWPAPVITFLVIAAWFSQSVMPYRLPGALDYSQFPMFQILHVAKRGLQFHELCVSVWIPRDNSVSVTFSGDDRRLFEYRFQKSSSSGLPSESLKQRLRLLTNRPDSGPPVSERILPLRSWNAEGWYVNARGSGIKAYTTEKRTIPPEEIVELFHELEATRQDSEDKTESRDVCLGFCFDPIAAMGWVFANHRCHNDGRHVSCR